MNNRILTIAASSLIAGTAMADYTGLTSTGANNGDGTWTARIYATFDAPTDELNAVFGDADDSLFISSNGAGFYQNLFGGPTSKSINPALYSAFPSLLQDSWVTICLEDQVDNNMLDIGIDWSGFENGGDISTENGSWFATPVDPLLPIGLPCTYQYLIGQFTIFGDTVHLSGWVNLQGKVGDFETFQARGETFDYTFTCDGQNDCNNNGVGDECDVSNGTSNDCNADGIPDECELVDNDCNSNGVPDECEITDGAADCNGNGIPDECELADYDCNENGIPDECDTVSGYSLDCDQNGVPDECQIDCDGDGWIDPCDILYGDASDIDEDGIPDNCEGDCNGNGIPDHFEIRLGIAYDCNQNDFIDQCDIKWGMSDDINQNGIPDECETDCNGNGVPDLWEIKTGQISDCNQNEIPDDCDIDSGWSSDINENGFPDECDDCNENGNQDGYDIEMGLSADVNANGVPDECECLADIDGSGEVDINDIIVVIGYWGSSIPGGDINYDGIVDILDMLILLSSWGPCE